MKPRPFHNVQGLTASEYRTLRDELRHPRTYWPELNRSDLRRALCAALSRASLFLKAEQALKALTSPRAFASGGARASAARLLCALDTRDLYLMRDVPARTPKVWSRNKARLAVKVDSALMEIAGAEFPDDAEVRCRCAFTLARWLQRRLPGMDRRLKPGPKTGKRKRLRKRKEQNHEKRD